MTDNDDPDPPRRIFSSPTRDQDVHYEEASVPAAYVARATRAGLAANHFAPTDPEVPSAKKRGVRRRRRSLVGLAALVVGLLSITVSLLYRAGRRVSALRAGGDAPHASILPRTDAIIFPQGNAPASIATGFRPPASTPYRNELDDDGHVDGRDEGRPTVGSTTAASAASQPKGPPHAIDIIRTPAF
jgi:hypothetical protein